MMGLEPTTFCMARGSWVRPEVPSNRIVKPNLTPGVKLPQGAKNMLFPGNSTLIGQGLPDKRVRQAASFRFAF
jgi:hypothetical protein